MSRPAMSVPNSSTISQSSNSALDVNVAKRHSHYSLNNSAECLPKDGADSANPLMNSFIASLPSPKDITGKTTTEFHFILVNN